MKRKKEAIVLGIMCMFLTGAIFIQIKTVNYMLKEVGMSVNDNNGLKDELFALQNKYNNLIKEIDDLERKLENTRTEAANNSEEEIRNRTRNKKR